MQRRLHTHSISPPHSNLLTLRTLAAPLNPADINQVQGTYAALPSFTSALGTSTPFAVPGNEGVFEVLSAGSSVKNLKRGDWCIPRRTGLGTWRTHLQVPEEQVVSIEKEGLQPKDAAAVSVNPITAWRLLRGFENLEEGEWVLQNGGNSGVGRAVIQLARQWGLKSLSVVRDRPGNEGEALKKELEGLGADAVLSEEEVSSKDFRARLKDLTQGRGARLALNCVGGKSALNLAKVLQDGGCMVTYGAMAKQPLTVPAGLLIFKNLRFEGFWVSKWADANPEEKIRVVEEVLDLVRQGGRFRMGPFEDVPWDAAKAGREELVEKVQGTLEGYRSGKGIFMFE